MKFRTIAFFIIGIGVLVYLLRTLEINLSDVIRSVKTPEYVIIAVVVVTVAPILYALRMRYIIFPMERRVLSLNNLFEVEFIFKFFSNVVPFKLNLPAKVVLLNKKCSLKLSSSASVVSFEYALDTALVILFGLLGAFNYFRNDTRISFASIEYFLVIILLFTIVFFSIPTDYFGKILNHAEHTPVKVIRSILTYGIKLLWAIRGTWAKLIFDREMIKVLITTAIIWGAAVLAYEILFLSTGIYVPPTWILVAMSSGIFVGGISTIPGGLGVREATMVLVYGYLGISNDVSVAVVLLGRILSTLPIIIGYLYSVKIGFDKLMKMETNL